VCLKKQREGKVIACLSKEVLFEVWVSVNEFIECQGMSLLSVSEWVYWVSGNEFIECQGMSLLSVTEWVYWVSVNKCITQVANSTEF
jgi:hypothetical protein